MSSTLDYTLQHIMNDCKPTQRLYPDSVPTGTGLASPGSNYATDAAAEPNPLPPLVTTHPGLALGKTQSEKNPDSQPHGGQT